jgi:hypothetical protein
MTDVSGCQAEFPPDLGDAIAAQGSQCILRLKAYESLRVGKESYVTLMTRERRLLEVRRIVWMIIGCC